MSVPGNSVSRYRGVGVASQTHSYADTKCGPAAVFSGGKTRAMQLTRTGHGISGFSFPSFDFTNDREHRRGIKGCGIRRERERERERKGRGEQSPLWKITYGQLALRFCGIAIHARTRTLARGARVRVRSNFTCNFAVEGAPRRMAGFLIISSCCRPGRILTGNNSGYGNSAIDIVCCWKAVDASTGTKQKWNFLLLARLVSSRVLDLFPFLPYLIHRMHLPTEMQRE